MVISQVNFTFTPMPNPSQNIKQLAQRIRKENEVFLESLKKTNGRDLDQSAIEAEEHAFTKIDCLDCANCCKSISPIVEFDDIHRVSKAMNMQAGDFIDQYLEMDEDGDFVFTSQPCPMLGEDNKCKVYESRPKACAEYPHISQKHLQKRLKLMLKNTEYCPAVNEALEFLKKAYS